MKNLFLALLFTPAMIYSQSQKLNGIDLNGPKGFVKTGNLTWEKGNNIISVQSFEGKFTAKEFEEICSKGSRATKYLSLETQEISGTEYQICLQFGDNGNLIGQGREAAKQALAEDENLMSKITDAILAKVQVSGGSVLAQSSEVLLRRKPVGYYCQNYEL